MPLPSASVLLLLKFKPVSTISTQLVLNSYLLKLMYVQFSNLYIDSSHTYIKSFLFDNRLMPLLALLAITALLPSTPKSKLLKPSSRLLEQAAVNKPLPSLTRMLRPSLVLFLP
jgi:hypothetical protein